MFSCVAARGSSLPLFPSTVPWKMTPKEQETQELVWGVVQETGGRMGLPETMQTSSLSRETLRRHLPLVSRDFHHPLHNILHHSPPAFRGLQWGQEGFPVSAAPSHAYLLLRAQRSKYRSKQEANLFTWFLHRDRNQTAAAQGHICTSIRPNFHCAIFFASASIPPSHLNIPPMFILYRHKFPITY